MSQTTEATDHIRVGKDPQPTAGIHREGSKWLGCSSQRVLPAPSPVPFPPPKPSPAPRLGPSKQCQYCVLLSWPPPHTRLSSTPASSPPGRDRLPGKRPALQPSLCRLSPKPSLELPPLWDRSYKSTKLALFWFLYLPLSLQTAASPPKQDTGTAGTLRKL
ncbi:unnamed protein product [Rangifer tarandus platyrhynchus]|uniref:Uncharacterized protein n=1 Tax=Rangifer tarandus platyrhynchus TaxID=3082113 RepID=A0AC59YBR9_RANTA